MNNEAIFRDDEKEQAVSRWQNVLFIHRFRRLVVGWLGNLRIGWKLALTFSLFAVLIVFITGVGYFGSTLTRATIDRTNGVQVPTVLTMMSAQSSLLNMRANLHGYLLLGDAQYREGYQRAQQTFEQDLAQLEGLSTQWEDAERHKVFSGLLETYTNWRTLPEQLFDLRDNPLENQPALRIVSIEGEPNFLLVLERATVIFREQMRREPSPLNYSVLRDISDFENSFALMTAYLRSYVFTHNAEFKQLYDIHQARNEAAWQRLNRARQYLTPGQQAQMDTIARNLGKIYALAPRAFNVLENNQSRKDLYLYRTQVVPIAEKMLLLLNTAVTETRSSLAAELDAGNQQLETTQMGILFSGLTILLLGGGLVFVLWRSIIEPINQLTGTAARIAGGNLALRVQERSKDEIGILAQAFNSMTGALQQRAIEVEQAAQERQRAQEERTLLQAEIIRAQEESIRELATPLVPLASGVVVMPLIGKIDAKRAAQITEVLLCGIAAQQAHTVILDMTGVPMIDQQIAEGLIQTARASRLLGAYLILTGIQPQSAQTLIELNANLSGITTYSTLQVGVEQALGIKNTRDSHFSRLQIAQHPA